MNPYDLHHIPFSSYGSCLAVSYPIEEEHPASALFRNTLCLRSLHGRFRDQDHYAFQLIDRDGNPLPYASNGFVGKGTMDNESNSVSFTFDHPDTLHIMGVSSGLRIIKTKIRPCDRVIPFTPDKAALAGEDGSFLLTTVRGRMSVKAPWSERGTGCESICVDILPDESGQVECTMTLYMCTYHERTAVPFDAAVAAMEAAFEAFAEAFPPVPDPYREGGLRALYMSWSCVMDMGDRAHTPIMPMSKNWMNFIWSWDHTFNALAMLRGNPELAWAQITAMADKQDQDGAYPDMFNAHTTVWSYVKPPVHGFMVRRMLKWHKPGQQTLEKVYQSLSRWTDWWMKVRINEKGIPMYFHGNDSGWDNGTVFQYGVPVCSPDCAAWLIVQMQTLSELALLLHEEAQAEEWAVRSEQFLERTLRYYGQGHSLTAKLMPDETDIHSESLLQFVPLILHEKLPLNIRDSLLHELLETNQYLTEYGLASEALDSPLFVEDGYWRGAVWPPLQYILAVALEQCGKKKEAKQLAASFCRMCLESGFAENYSPIDGRALRDPAYTWSSSIYLLFVWEFLCP